MPQALPDRRRFLTGLLAGLAIPAIVRPAQAADKPVPQVDWNATPQRLLMVERRGCIYCERWDAEIAPGYPKTDEGRAAPLLRVDVNGPWPDGLVLDRAPFITPTFILLDRGFERARLEGYPGDIHFYPVLRDMLKQAAATGKTAQP